MQPSLRVRLAMLITALAGIGAGCSEGEDEPSPFITATAPATAPTTAPAGSTPPDAGGAVGIVRDWIAERNDALPEDSRRGAWRLKEAHTTDAPPGSTTNRVTVTADVEVAPTANRPPRDLALQFVVVPSADEPVRQVLFLMPRAGGAAGTVGGAMLGKR